MKQQKRRDYHDIDPRVMSTSTANVWIALGLFGALLGVALLAVAK